MTALIMSGCILERIFRVKDQLCDFDNNFTIEISEGFRVILREPVLLDDDIAWLTGAEPSRQEHSGHELIMTYIAEKRGSQSNAQYDIPIELRFIRINQDYRLKECYFSKNLTDILSDQLLTQLIQSICRSEKSLVQQRITVDISMLNQLLLPSKSDLVTILGPPNRDSGNELMLLYDYQLKNHSSMDAAVTIEILFDKPAGRIRRMKVRYLRYHLDANFEEGEAVLKLDVFYEVQARSEDPQFYLESSPGS